MHKLLASISTFSMLCCAISANAQNLSAISAAAKLTEVMQAKVVQQKLADCDFSSPHSRVIAGVQMTTSPDGSVLLSGKDRLGREWTVSYPATPGAGCQLWTADLARNGLQDLIFVGFGANTSGGWDTTLMLLLYDDQGQPFPWQTTSKFTVDASGVDELIRLAPEARPAVIVPERQTDQQGQSVYEYSLFGFKGNKVDNLKGLHADIDWPLVSPSTSRALFADEKGQRLSNIDPVDAATQKPAHFKGLKGTNDADREVVFSDKSIYMPELLIIDSARGRAIISSPGKSDFQAIKSDQSDIVTRGNDCTQDECRPVVMWVRQ